MSKDLKRPSNNHPDGSLPKHRKSDEVIIKRDYFCKNLLSKTFLKSENIF